MKTKYQRKKVLKIYPWNLFSVVTPEAFFKQTGKTKLCSNKKYQMVVKHNQR